MPKRSGKRSSHNTPRARAEVRAQQHLPRITLIAGLTIIALAVIGGFVLSFYPKAFGLSESNPAVGFGLAALACFRLWALRRELRRQEES